MRWEAKAINSDISQAILSVYDKTGLLDLAKGLVKQNIRLLASGGTSKLIREGGFPVEYEHKRKTAFMAK